MKSSPSLQQICRWLADLGYDGEMPTDPAEGMKLLRRLQRKYPPSEKQLAFLQSLGHAGKPPKTMAKAAELIEKLQGESHEHVASHAESMVGKSVTKKQSEYLESLGYEGPPPKDRAEASRFLDALLNGADPEHLDEYFEEENEPPWNGFDAEPDVPGTRRFTFSVRELKAIRQRIHKALPDIDLHSVMPPEGWSYFSGSWDRLFKSLKHLKIKDGFTLGAILFREGDNGNGFVFGIPVNKEPPLPYKPLQEATNHLWEPPPSPEGSVDRYMTLFSMDGTPEACMEAAMLARELDEFGAAWHGAYWGCVRIFGPRQVLDLRGKSGRCRKDSMDDDYYFPYETQQNVSRNAQPVVIMRPEKTVFRHLAHCQLMPGRLTLDRYVFRDETAEFEFESIVLAESAGGIIH